VATIAKVRAATKAQAKLMQVRSTKAVVFAPLENATTRGRHHHIVVHRSKLKEKANMVVRRLPQDPGKAQFLTTARIARTWAKVTAELFLSAMVVITRSVGGVQKHLAKGGMLNLVIPAASLTARIARTKGTAISKLFLPAMAAAAGVGAQNDLEKGRRLKVVIFAAWPTARFARTKVDSQRAIFLSAITVMSAGVCVVPFALEKGMILNAVRLAMQRTASVVSTAAKAKAAKANMENFSLRWLHWW